MKPVRALLLLPLAALLAYASPNSSRRTNRAPPRRDHGGEAPNGHEHLLPPQDEEGETMMPFEAQGEDVMPEVLPFEAAQFDLYDGRDHVRLHLAFLHPEPDETLAIDPRRDNYEAFLARRRAALAAFRRGDYHGNYQLDRHNDLIRQNAMCFLSNWRHDVVGSGALYDLDGKTMLIHKDMSDAQARGMYNLGNMAIFYTDRTGRLHFTTRYDHSHPGPFNNYTALNFNADQQYRQNIRDQLFWPDGRAGVEEEPF